MHIIMVGLNHRTAPVEIREQFTLDSEELPKAVGELRQRKSILESVIVSTCNRTEVYIVADQIHTGRYYTKVFLSDWFGLPKESFTSYLDIRENDAAVEHLFRVASGLDSLILGETQILGQVRESFFAAQSEGTTGTMFNKLFKQAITHAKAVHSSTGISENPVSVSYAAVELAKQIFGDLHKKNVLIIGAGKMSELTAKHLHSGGVANVTVANRTFEKADGLAKQFSGRAVPFEDIDNALVSADILISSTGSKDHVFQKEAMEQTVRKRKGKPLFMVDIAVPRDIDPRLQECESVFLYDIDDLNGIVEANLAQRREQAEKIEVLIEKELVSFKEWLSTLGVVPVISALRQKALTIQSETMQSIQRKMPDLTEREKKVISKHTKSIVNQLLRDPVSSIKELAAEQDKEEVLALFTKIFSIEEEVDRELKKQAAEDFSNDYAGVQDQSASSSQAMSLRS